AAGRTDAGVHAVAQVAHFKTESDIPSVGIMKGVNSLLPDDIAIVAAEDVSLDFHSRKDAKSKRYLYRILLCDQRMPLFAERVWHLNGGLDLAAMKDASGCLIGINDYESFRAAGCSSGHAIREITSIEFSSSKEDWQTGGQGELIEITFEGTGFVRHMIRNIVGTLIEVGRGKIDANEVSRILDEKNRQVAGICAPACGLYLVAVCY
ncbi:unnamed protein product, partial [marine sediment metagenome]